MTSFQEYLADNPDLRSQVNREALTFSTDEAFAKYVDELLATSSWVSYRPIKTNAYRFAATLKDRSGAEALAAFLRAVLLQLMQRSLSGDVFKQLDPILAHGIEPHFVGIAKTLQNLPTSYFDYGNDRFVKDIAVCALRLLPFGAELVDRYSSLPRRIAISGGISQCFRYLQHIVSARLTSGHWYESHWDRRLSRHFSPEGYLSFYRLLRDAIALDDEAAGYVGTSWWFDPNAQKISPELDFLVNIPLSNGAGLFRVGLDRTSTADALRFSTVRKSAYESGSYSPQAYMLVWPRSALLGWHRSG